MVRTKSTTVKDGKKKAKRVRSVKKAIAKQDAETGSKTKSRRQISSQKPHHMPAIARICKQLGINGMEKDAKYVVDKLTDYILDSLVDAAIGIQSNKRSVITLAHARSGVYAYASSCGARAFGADMIRAGDAGVERLQQSRA